MPLIILILFLLTVIIQLVAFVLVLIRMFKKEGVLKGILGFIIGIYAFIWGWIKHKELQLTKVMLIWSISMVAQVVIMIMGMSVLMVWMQSEFKSDLSAITTTQPPRQPAATSTPKKAPPAPKPASDQKAVQPGLSTQEIANKINNLNQMIDQNKENADAYYSRGWLYGYQGDFQNALKDYSEAIRINKAYVDAYYNRGLVYTKMGRFDQAIADFSQVLSFAPRSVDVYCNRGNVYLQSGQAEQAIRDYTEALKFSPKDADIYYNRGMAYRIKDEQKKAEEDFQAAAKLGHGKAKKILVALKEDKNKKYISQPVEKIQAPTPATPVKSPQGAPKTTVQKSVEKPKVPAPQISTQSRQNIDKKTVKESIKKPEAQTPPASKVKGQGTVKMAIKKPAENPNTTKAPASPIAAKETTREPQVKPVETAKVQTKPVTPSKLDWNMEPDSVVIPEYPVSGQIHGEDFTVDTVKIEGGILTLRKGKDFLPDQATLIFLFLPKDEKLDGKTYHITRDQGYGVPHVHIKWRVSGKDVPETDMFMRDYAMRLEFGRMENGKIPGKLYLSLPDKMQSYMAGTFMAEVK